MIVDDNDQTLKDLIILTQLLRGKDNILLYMLRILQWQKKHKELYGVNSLEVDTFLHITMGKFN
jgi:hypothetical protein